MFLGKQMNILKRSRDFLLYTKNNTSSGLFYDKTCLLSRALAHSWFNVYMHPNSYLFFILR